MTAEVEKEKGPAADRPKGNTMAPPTLPGSTVGASPTGSSGVNGSREKRGAVYENDPWNQIPPHSLIDEKAALGCVLLAGESGADWAALLGQLELSHFYDLRHKATFRTIKAMVKDGITPSPLSLAARLMERKTAEEAGGIAYVAGLDNDLVPWLFGEHLDKLKDKEYRRTILEAMKRAAVMAMDGTYNPDALVDDIKACIGSMVEPAGPSIVPIDLSKPPPPFHAVYSLAETPICTAGNLTAVTAAAKAGKTAIIGAFTSAPMVPDGFKVDTLGISSRNPAGKALLHFDTEQSPDDQWHQIHRAVRRAGLSAPPPWLNSYSLTGLSHTAALRVFRDTLKASADRFGGIHAVFLDGAADFVADVNDAGESNAWITELHGLAITYSCPMVGVIHFNPGSEKVRGHLGSQLERKAETNLRLDKVDGITTVWSDKQRRAPIPKGTGPSFQWDDKLGMHVSVETREAAKDQIDKDRLSELAVDVFRDRPSMRFTDLQTTIKTSMKVSEATAERKLAKMIKLGVIEKSVAGLYIRAA